MQLFYKNKKQINEIEKLIDEIKKQEKSISINNRKGAFIHGDNFISMIKLLNNFEEKIDLIYIDPPFNTNSNFYYGGKRTATISTSKDDIIAYTDNMSMEDYLEFLRERLVVIKKLLSSKGTLYVHIDCKVGHYVKIILDEIFGIENYINDITRVKSNPKNFNRKAFGNEKDVIYIYSKKNKKNIFNQITEELTEEELKKLFPKVDELGRKYTTVPCHAPGETKIGETGKEWRGMLPPKGRHWRCSPHELEKLNAANLIEWSKNGVPRIKKFADEHKGKKIQDIWRNYKDPQYPLYPTEKNIEMLNMIIEQSSNLNSIIMDCFCGSSAFLKAGILKNRFVIGIDKSNVAREILQKRSELKELEIIEI